MAEGNQRALKTNMRAYSYVNPKYSQLYLNEYSVLKAIRVYGLGRIVEKLGNVVGERQCGHLFDPDINCSCAESRVRSYFDKIAGPILDRIDMEVLVNRVDYKDLLSKNYSENSTAIKQMHLSARGFFKILKVARTIADLDNKNDIQKNHILEALSYKNLHRNYDV